MTDMQASERTEISKRVTLVGAIANILLSVLKVVFGFVAQSHALIVDGIHSLSDLISDAMVWFASHHAQHGPDEKHPYGHGRFETIATLGLGIILILVAIGIVWDSAARLFSPEKLLHPGALALVVAILSVLVKEALYHYTMLAGRKINSKMIQANAWHHRTDAISSIVVVVGVAGTIAGLPYLDTVAAVIVGVMIAMVGWELGWPALEELMDAGLEQERLEKVKEIIHSVDGVDSIHLLRSRSIGGEIIVDVHILVAPWMSVTEGHMISQTVMERLLGEVDEISDVTVHVDPEDDEAGPATQNLPLRQQALEKLGGCWATIPEVEKVTQTILHYREGKIDIDLYFPLSCYDGDSKLQELRAGLLDSLEGEDDFRELKIFFG